MRKLFEEDKYNFMDSIIDKIELSDNLKDYLITIDYYQGKQDSKILVLRLRNATCFVYHNENIKKRGEVVNSLTIAHISKKITDNGVEITIESALSCLPEHENDPLLIRCLCENAYIES